jgi:hypothetical protein
VLPLYRIVVQHLENQILTEVTAEFYGKHGARYEECERRGNSEARGRGSYFGVRVSVEQSHEEVRVVAASSCGSITEKDAYLQLLEAYT